MKVNQITCPMCGYRFDPADNAACQSCPLQKDCQLVCCPVCGYETVDPSRSTLARLAARWLSPKTQSGGQASETEPPGSVDR